MLREAPLVAVPWAAPAGPAVVTVALEGAAAGNAPVVDRRTNVRLFDNHRRRADDPVGLPARAGTALLMLQLRTALQEAAETEAEEASWNLDTALAQLRARLGPLVEDRRRALDLALAQARTEADAAVAAARAEVSTIAHDAPSTAVGVVPSVALELSSTVADITKHVLVSSDDRDPSSTTVVVVDPDSFSRAFAAAFAVAFATVLDERFAGLAGGAPAGPAWHVAPTPVPARKSFWAGMWHADVFLSLVAMLVVLVVLVAWSV